MKKLTLLAVTILICTCSFAQQKKAAYAKEGTKNSKYKKQLKTRCPIVYLTTSTGINNNTGFLGIGLDLAVAPHASVDMGIGVGTWGYKACLGAKYYMKACHTGWAFGGGLTYATGERNFNYNLETVYGTTEPVVLNLLPQTNVFIAAYKYWNIGRRYNRFYLELGYSVRIAPTRFEQTAGDEISDNSVKTMNVLSPGGLIIGTGFSFGIPRRK